MEICKATGLFDQCWGQTVCIGLVVNEFRVHEVVDLQQCVQSLSSAKPISTITHIPLQRPFRSRSVLSWNGTSTYHVLQGSRPTKNEIFNGAKERLRIALHVLELPRRIEFFRVFLKRLKASRLRYYQNLN